MAMVSVVNWQPTSGLMAQADRLGPKVGGHLAPCCTHRNAAFSMMTATINIVLVLLLLVVVVVTV